MSLGWWANAQAIWLRFVVALMILLLNVVWSVRAQQPIDKTEAKKPAELETKEVQKLSFEQLLTQLLETSEQGLGYSSYQAGSEFLPLPNSNHFSSGILGVESPKPSASLREIVRRGAVVVPQLLKHLDDKRPTKIEPIAGHMWMDFPDEYDFNRRTTKTPPKDVNRDDLNDPQANHPGEHQLTIGDLCFVALGQIVNREFSACRYQATGGAMINSPSYSERLRKAILAEWTGLTVEKHRASLIADLAKPDDESRKSGAYTRLAFYYPEEVEPLVLAELARPLYDDKAIDKFCKETLYKSEAAHRKQYFEGFVRQHGEPAAEGVCFELFVDLQREHTAPKAREILVQLFDQPNNVQFEDHPYPQGVPLAWRGYFIESLTRDRSAKIGARVQEIYLQYGDAPNIAEGCLKSLASRDFSPFLIDQLATIDWQLTTYHQLHYGKLSAIVTSADPKVHAALWERAQQTPNIDYFLMVVPLVGKTHDAVLLKVAQQHLSALPADTVDATPLLYLMIDRFPQQARETFRQFLKPNTVNRNEAVCRVLQYGDVPGDPIGPELLAPLLDDEHEVDQFFGRKIFIRDRAAEALSRLAAQLGTPIPFSSLGSESERAQGIAEMKKFCAEQQAKSRK